MTEQSKDKITKIIKALLAKAAGSERRVRQRRQPKASP